MKGIKTDDRPLIEREKRRRWMLYGTAWIPEMAKDEKPPEEPEENKPMSGISAAVEPEESEHP